MAHEGKIAGLRVLGDALGHAADGKVFAVQLQRGNVQSSRHGRVFTKAGARSRSDVILAQRPQELLHVKGTHRHDISLADREGKFLPVHSDAEQASGDDDVILGRLFAKVFQRGQRAFAQLHLVENDQRLSAYDRLSADMRQHGQQRGRADIFVKGGSQSGVRLEIKIGDVVVMFAAEFKHGPRFADLPRALDDQRLAIRTVFPRFKIRRDLSLHCHHLLSFLTEVYNKVV